MTLTFPMHAVSPDPDGADQLRQRLDRVQAGELPALGELFQEFGPLVFRTAHRLTGQREDAEDVTQEVFLRLPAAIGGFTGTVANFPGWMRRIAVRQALMHLRGGKRRREVNVESLSLFAKADSTADRLTLESALSQLSPDHRTVFLLKEVEGYDHAEIAEALGISVSNSEVRLHRARRQLRDLLRASR